MTSKLVGVDKYYTTLDSLNTPSILSGRVTAELELALPGKFEIKNSKAYSKEGFPKK